MTRTWQTLGLGGFLLAAMLTFTPGTAPAVEQSEQGKREMHEQMKNEMRQLEDKQEQDRSDLHDKCKQDEQATETRIRGDRRAVQVKHKQAKELEDANKTTEGTTIH